jgi:hypothetical protein
MLNVSATEITYVSTRSQSQSLFEFYPFSVRDTYQINYEWGINMNSENESNGISETSAFHSSNLTGLLSSLQQEYDTNYTVINK